MSSTMQQYRDRISRLTVLLGGKCTGCGATQDLQFDHIDPTTKLFTVTKGWAFSWEKVLAEAKKCQLLCKKCHEAKSLAAGDIPPRALHGTEGRYRHHRCRCVLCREAHRDKMREYRLHKNGV
jgi:5-methylcytosine-specific restriction endonuclease McrA